MVLSLDRWVGKVAVVTGTSSGIGAAIAERLVEEGLQVVGLARRKDRLDELSNKLSGKKGKFFPIKADVSKEEDILNAFKWIKDNLGPVHILINNAAYMKTEFISSGSTEVWKQIFDVNVIGLSIATREAVKDMKANNVNGHIIHINSVVGNQAVPGLSVYPSSKFAVRALAETLRLELNSLKLKIKITNISPGFIDTEMTAAFKRGRFYEEGKILEAEQIVDGVVYALSTPPHVQIQQLTIQPILDLDASDLRELGALQ